jgi:hypothetical protein
MGSRSEPPPAARVGSRSEIQIDLLSAEEAEQDHGDGASTGGGCGADRGGYKGDDCRDGVD